MARKRMIDPGIWTDDGMAELTPRQQLLYIGLFSNADDQGRLKGSPTAIRLMLPGIYGGVDLDDIAEDLDDILQVMTQLRRYTVNERDYLAFENYPTWQKIDKPQDSVLPPPPERSTNDPGTVDEQSPNDPGTVVPNRIEKNRIEKNMATDKPSRKRDPVFEQVVRECYDKPWTDLTETERKRANKASRELREIKATADDVKQRATRYRARSPNYPLTPQTLTKSWTDLGKSMSTNGIPPPKYKTVDEIRQDREAEARKHSP